MGAYHIFVNPVRKEFFDPAAWGDGNKKASLFHGLHRYALKLLLYSAHAAREQLSPTLLSWVGDPVLIAADDYATDQESFLTATADDPERNLYYLAREEFRDVTPELTCLLVANEDEFTKGLMERATQNSRVLISLGALYYETSSVPLKRALENYLGKEWEKMYGLAVKMGE